MILQSKGLSKVFSNTTVEKHQFFVTQAFFNVQLSYPYMTPGKIIALTIWTSVGKVMSLLFNMLSRLVIAFLSRSKHLLISCLESPSTVILEHKKIKSFTVSIVSPSICHEVMGLDAMILVFWMLSFKPTFSLSSLTFNRLFSSALLSAIMVVSSAYLRLLIFLLAILIPVYDSSNLARCMMYFAHKLNKQGDNIHLVQFNCSVMSDSLRPHGLQHTRLPCPSPVSGVYSNSCPLSWWCHPAISSSVVPFSSCLQSFPV